MKKFLKRTGIVILVLLVVYLILCIAGPKEVVVTRSTTINVTPDVVMNKLGDFKFFVENWSPWSKKDPNAKMTYEGEAQKPGHKFTWEGNDTVGAGMMVLDSVLPNKVVETLAFKRPWESQAKVWLTADADGSGTKVTWGMQMNTPFFFRGMMLFMNMDKMLGPDYEEGLASLKQVLEAMPAESANKIYNGYEVKEMDWPEKTYFGKKATVKMAEVGAFYGKNLPAIFGELKKNKIEQAGAPVGLFWSWDMANMTSEMAAALPVAIDTKEIKGLEKFSVPAGKAIMVDYMGGYTGVKAAHDAIGQYEKEKGLSHSVSIEEYVTDPMTEKDSTKWMTKIYYILK